MPDQNLPEDLHRETGGSESHSDRCTSEVQSGLTLESIIDLTGELAHLNELVVLHLEKGVVLPVRNRILRR